MGYLEIVRTMQPLGRWAEALAEVDVYIGNLRELQ